MKHWNITSFCFSNFQFLHLEVWLFETAITRNRASILSSFIERMYLSNPERIWWMLLGVYGSPSLRWASAMNLGQAAI